MVVHRVLKSVVPGLRPLTQPVLMAVLSAALLAVLGTGLWLAAGPWPSLAQEPQGVTAQDMPGTAFTYQGQLKKAGAVVSDTCNFQFSLYSDSGGTLPVGSPQTKSGVGVSSGLFTVDSLDFGAAAFNGQARWLKIAVQCTGDGSYQDLSPLQALRPAPHAQALPGLYTLQNATSPDLIGGYFGNSVTSGAAGATIGGGGYSGNLNRVTDDYGTVGGGALNRAGDDAGTTSDARYGTVGGGLQNTASAERATVGGGRKNVASGPDATVSGGYSNTAGVDYATVGGGNTNTASGPDATVSGGYSNTASGWDSTVGGGAGNTASKDWATVGGGQENTASGYRATVPGGYNNTAAGSGSFAAGRRAKANHDGAFVWGDYTNADINSSANNQFLVRANGVWFGKVTSDFTPTIGTGVFISTTTGGYLSTGGVWTNVSDRDAKENFAPVDGRQVLARLATVPVSTWNYKAQDAAVRHIGPMAQDFHAAFGVGDDNTHLATVDTDGVALAAIQGLYGLVREKDAQIAAQQQQIAALQARMAQLEATAQGGQR